MPLFVLSLVIIGFMSMTTVEISKDTGVNDAKNIKKIRKNTKKHEKIIKKDKKTVK